MQHNGAWTRQKPTGLIVGFCAYFEHCFSSATPGGAAFAVMYDFYREAGKSSSWPVAQCFRETCAPWLLPGSSSVVRPSQNLLSLADLVMTGDQ